MSGERAEAQITFRLPKRLAASLDRIASQRGVQRSDLLREAAEKVVAEDERRASHFENVKDLIGSIHSGISDLGSEHRRHLKQAFRRGR
jgi:metal-responsive CopG/Arc/MetJ family transcriptional regulator